MAGSASEAGSCLIREQEYFETLKPLLNIIIPSILGSKRVKGDILLFREEDKGTCCFFEIGLQTNLVHPVNVKKF